MRFVKFDQPMLPSHSSVKKSTNCDFKFNVHVLIKYHFSIIQIILRVRINAHFSLANEQLCCAFRSQSYALRVQMLCCKCTENNETVISHSEITQIFRHRQRRHAVLCSDCGILDALFDDSLRSGSSYYMIRCDSFQLYIWLFINVNATSISANRCFVQHVCIVDNAIAIRLKYDWTQG